MKKLIVAAAGAASVFAVTVAGASALPLAGGASTWSKHQVQQSDQVTATCSNGNVETAYTVDGTDVESLTVLQQYIQGCLGSEFQAVVFDANGDQVKKSEIVRYGTPGSDLVLSFPGRVDPQDVATMRLTIADRIAR
jgi:hypothetical protein